MFCRGFVKYHTGNRLHFLRVSKGYIFIIILPNLFADTHPPQDTIYYMSPTVAITGSSGFIGSHLIKILTSKGVPTLGLDLLEPQDDAAPSSFIKLDIREESKVKAALKDINIVYHLASAVPLASKMGLESVNVEGSKIVASASQAASVFINVSSSAVYGRPVDLPVLPSTPTRPVEQYGRSKLLAERTIKEALAPNTRLVNIRPRTVLGPQRGGIFSVLFDLLDQNLPLPVLGSSTIIQFLHVNDLVEALLVAAESGTCPEVVNIGAPSPRQLRLELSDLVSHANSSSKVMILPKRLSMSAAALASKLRLSPLAPWHTSTYGVSNFVDLSPAESAGIVPKYSNYATLLDAYSNRPTSSDRSPHTSVLSAPLLMKTLRVLGGTSRG